MEQFDVFISYKNTGKNGRPTRDAAMAEALYRDLKKKGIRVFFSKYSIDNAARADYMKMIDHALESASILVAVGTSRENLDSGWVYDEINTFRTMLNSERNSNRSIISFRSSDYSPNELPPALRQYQSYDDQNSVVRFIVACLKKASGFRTDENITQLIYDDNGEATSCADAHHNELKRGDVLGGRYEILNTIGQGGCSRVHLTMDRRARRLYALKELCSNPYLDFETVREGLRVETALMQTLDHPAIPKIRDVFDNSDSYIIVMDYISGSSLMSILKKKGPFSEKEVLDFTRQIAKVLSYLHNRPKPIIYRDLKPANLMLNSDGILSLIDFGTARQYKNHPLIEDTTCLGTVGFAAPEQYGGKGQSDARTDIYNLGATLYNLVTGKSPAEPPYEMLPIRQIDPNLSRGLEFIIEKCTRKDPNCRFQSAEELLDALDHLNRLGTMSLLSSIFNGSIVKTASRPKKRKQASPPLPLPAFTPGIPGPPAPVQVPPPVVPGSSPVAAVPVTSAASTPVSVEPVPIIEAEQTIYNAPTEVLTGPPPCCTAALPEAAEEPALPEPVPEADEPPSAPKKTKAHVRKVTVRTGVPAKQNGEMDELIAKLMALEPDSQQLVRDLIERLSKSS